MKNRTVFVAAMRLGLTRMPCVAVLLFAISACGSGGGEGSVSGNSSGGGRGSAVEIKLIAANDGVNGDELWKSDGTERRLLPVCRGEEVPLVR